MEATVGDWKVASLAAGFSLGFGFLTVWKAINQTRSIKQPHRSVYIIIVWGEIIANLGLGIVAWLYLEELLPHGIAISFFLLFFWVFEIQFLLQIIINRINIVAENKRTVAKVKWATAGVVTVINILVFCIWIPAHLDPPPNQTYVVLNRYWDPTSKVLICIIDAGLNIWFLRIVRRRLVRFYGLKKYAPLVRFNAWLMVLSIAMDVLLIGLMFLRNGLVFIQFHPVTYMVKLNIEMTMASLITKLARGSSQINVSDLVDDGPASHEYPGASHTEKETGTKISVSDEEPIEMKERHSDSGKPMEAPLVTTQIDITTHDIEAASGKSQHPREAF